jgi:type III secretion protein Q
MNGQAAVMQEVFTSLAAAGAAGLRRVDPAAARWSRLLHDARLAAALQRDQPRLVLHAAETPPTGPALAVELVCDGETIEVELAEAEHPALAMAVGPRTSDAMRHLAAQALFGPVADRLERLGLGRCWARRASVRTIAPPRSHGTASPWFCIRHQTALLATLRITQAAPAWVEAFKEALCAQGLPLPHHVSWALPARVTVHAQDYGSSLLAGLVVGDVLVLPCPVEQGASWPVVVRWGAAAGRSLRVSGRMVGTKVVIEGAHSVVNEDIGQEAAADQAQEIHCVDNIDIPVRFELETVPVPLSEIESLAPGFVIELASPLERASLRLVVCGQVIGLAELVAVGDRLGARIVRLGAK